MSRTNGLYRRAYIGGTFDCLHRGHLDLLRKVRTIAVETIVSVNTDEFAARYKRHPFMPLEDRIEALVECRLVDHVIVNEGDEDSKVSIALANVDCIVHGSDWTGEALLRQMSLTQEWLDANGIEMVYVPYSCLMSTSTLLEMYEKSKNVVPEVVWPSDTVMCKGCNRAMNTTDVDSDGNCGNCTTQPPLTGRGLEGSIFH